MEVKANIKQIKRLLKEKKTEELKVLVNTLRSADFSEIAQFLSSEEILEIFRLIEDRETLADYIADLPSELQSSLLAALGKKQASEILEEMDTDEAVDILTEIAPDASRELLDLMHPEEADEIEQLMQYKENTAGSIMNNEFVALPEYLTAEQAIQRIREMSPEAEMIYYVYVLDQKKRLIGVLSLRDLIVADSKKNISQIMEEDVISVLDTEDQEVAARVISDYDFLAIPVVNNQGVMVGIITVDDIIDVLEDEVTEDIHKMVGSNEFYEDSLIKASSLQRAKARLPWLMVCLVGQMISGKVIEFHSGILQMVLALAFFIPIIMDMGGNIGSQSSTVTVRGLATGQLRLDELWRNVWAETTTGFFIGLFTSMIIFLFTFVWQKDYILSLSIGLSAFVTAILAATTGTLLPLIFTRFKIDPAIAAGPFITTINDVINLTVYFTIATFLFSYLR